MRDDPYNQNAVNKGFNSLEKIISILGEKVYYSFGIRRDEFSQTNVDECVLVYHSWMEKSNLNAGVLCDFPITT